jgi:hypothetical protein
MKSKTYSGNCPICGKKGKIFVESSSVFLVLIESIFMRCEHADGSICKNMIGVKNEK